MTNTTASAVLDGTKMTDEQLGKLTRRSDELKRRINEGTLEYDQVMDELQQVIEGRKSETPAEVIIAERPQSAPLPMAFGWINAETHPRRLLVKRIVLDQAGYPYLRQYRERYPTGASEVNFIRSP